MPQLTRRSFLGAGAGLALAETRRPNILWISCEDTGPQLGCYGDPDAITPNLDRLASQGVRYTHAYTVAGVCAPSRSGIITGMYPTSLGSQHMRCRAALPPHVKCFPEYLRRAGYYSTNNAKTDYNFPVPEGAWDESSRQAHWKNRKPGQPFFAVFNIETTHESRIVLRGEEFAKTTSSLKAGERRDPARLGLPPYYPDTPEARRDWANYHEIISQMDYQFAARLKELEDAGLADDTIVFFWGDHGVGLPRAKRWLYESSTHVPLIIRIPEKFRAAGQGRPGSTDDQLISFIDLAPTVLNLAGVEIPQHMQGRAFLGGRLTPPRQYVYGVRDRMDERYDIVRSVRDRRYRYIRNYEAYKPYAQHMRTPERGPTMMELRRLKAEGKLPKAAEQFMADRKPAEELYDTENDRFEIRNLAGDPNHRSVLERLRKAHAAWMHETLDLGLIPEGDMRERGRTLGSEHAILQQPENKRLLGRLLDTVRAGEAGEALKLRAALEDKDAAVRFWAVTGLANLGKGEEELLRKALRDPAANVRIAAARGLALRSRDTEAIPALTRELAGEQEWNRLRAAIALDEMGERARPALAALKVALTPDQNDYVARVVSHAVSVLESRAGA